MRWLLALLIIALPAAHAAELYVIDGDTVRLGEERIRIQGINAPDLFSPKCERERALAEASADALRDELHRGSVDVRRSGVDRYGRTLARILVDGRDAGEILMARGLARPWFDVLPPGWKEPWCEGVQ